MSTFNQAFDVQPAGQSGALATDEYQIRQDLMAIKAEGQSQFDREMAAFHASIENHRQSVEQQLRADVDPALSTAVSQAHQSLLAARRQAAQARQALDQHNQARPRLAADVPTWSRQRTDKVGELEAFEAIAADLDAAHRQAQERVAQALQQAFTRRLGEAQAAYDRRNADVAREFKARMTALNEWRASAQKELTQLGEQIGYWQRYQ